MATVCRAMLTDIHKKNKCDYMEVSVYILAVYKVWMSNFFSNSISWS